MRQYIGHLSVDDPLHGWLRDAVLPQLAQAAREPRFRVFRIAAATDVYLYEDKWSGAGLVGKFYARARGLNGSNAPQSARHEYDALAYLRRLGFDASPDYVARPLGVKEDLGDLLVTELVAGEPLDALIDTALRDGRFERLYRKLGGLARFLARLHNRLAGPERVDFTPTQAYFDRVLAYLAANGAVSARRADRLSALGHAYAGEPAYWQDVRVLVHGDATPSNFLFGRAQDVFVIDLERIHRDDRVYDVGRLCGELKHCFLRATGDPGRAEPFIGHFLWEYAGHFPDRGPTFAALTSRLPFYLGLTLLRIARNAWLDEAYRKRLVHEAGKILSGGLA
ncbi:MAG: aminoglycoside phosphotransferase family protein [Solidesulfovibrio sp. DCME]|uniref:aminoglycoside phosphotransferase family protein n=1 Tax=Solidesulfovibrio sp. DCME TaxID=3447380 RepID=UPI003D1054A9